MSSGPDDSQLVERREEFRVVTRTRGESRAVGLLRRLRETVLLRVREEDFLVMPAAIATAAVLAWLLPAPTSGAVFAGGGSGSLGGRAGIYVQLFGVLGGLAVATTLPGAWTALRRGELRGWMLELQVIVWTGVQITIAGGAAFVVLVEPDLVRASGLGTLAAGLLLARGIASALALRGAAGREVDWFYVPGDARPAVALAAAGVAVAAAVGARAAGEYWLVGAAEALAAGGLVVTVASAWRPSRP